jgi:hypothetical protein
VQERPSGSSRSADHLFGQNLRVRTVVCIFVRDDIHQAAPTTAEADDAVTLSKCANRNGSNSRIEAWHVAAPS